MLCIVEAIITIQRVTEMICELKLANTINENHVRDIEIKNIAERAFTLVCI